LALLNGRIKLHLDKTAEKILCIDSAYDTVQYVLRGSINNSGIDVKAIGFSRHYTDRKLDKDIDYLIFSEDCFSDKSGSIHCVKTSDANIFEIILSTTLKLTDSKKYLRAVIFTLGDKEFSPYAALPVIVNKDDIKIDYELKVNNVSITSERHIIEVMSMTINIFYRLIAPLDIPVTLIVTIGNESREIRENVSEHFNFESSDQKVIWRFQICNVTVRNGTIE
ncbi:hypothetical protein BgiBS90_019559, partial [Biomphalaria glabrata]